MAACTEDKALGMGALQRAQAQMPRLIKARSLVLVRQVVALGMTGDALTTAGPAIGSSGPQPLLLPQVRRAHPLYYVPSLDAWSRPSSTGKCLQRALSLRSTCKILMLRYIGCTAGMTCEHNILPLLLVRVLEH